jgi:hypothetical protein
MFCGMVLGERGVLSKLELKGRTLNVGLSPVMARETGKRGVVRRCQLKLSNRSHHTVKS